MKSLDEAIAFGLSFPDTYMDRPFRGADWTLIRIRENKKTFLCIYEHQNKLCINIKVKPEWRDFWIRTYSAVLPAYHQNKEHWITIVLDGSIPDADMHRMIGESYDLVTYSAAKQIYEAVKKIPKGRVATYAQVAAMAGNPRMSRAVGNALHKNPDPEGTPCYRVVNAKGELSGAFAFGGAKVQQSLLEADGIEVIKGRVDLERFGIMLLQEEEMGKEEAYGKDRYGCDSDAVQ